LTLAGPTPSASFSLKPQKTCLSLARAIHARVHPRVRPRVIRIKPCTIAPLMSHNMYFIPCMFRGRRYYLTYPTKKPIRSKVAHKIRTPEISTITPDVAHKIRTSEISTVMPNVAHKIRTSEISATRIREKRTAHVMRGTREMDCCQLGKNSHHDTFLSQMSSIAFANNDTIAGLREKQALNTGNKIHEETQEDIQE
jgi:hypothetical protein